VHGYNNSFSDGVFRAAQLAHDFELRGIALHYSWPSIAHPLGYSHDRDSLLFARDGLEDMLRDVAASGAQNVVLVGHSLGAMLVMETLRQIDIAKPGQPDRWLDGVVLLSPDVDLDLFKAQADRISALPQPFAIFVSQKDRALMLSSQINGRSKRLGSLSDPRALADLQVTVLDVTAFSDSVMQSHFTTGNSPALIKLLSRSADLSNAFAVPSVRGRGGLPGVALTVPSATQIILSPGLLTR
jgi:esterase/lipase superfamily enzyme